MIIYYKYDNQIGICNKGGDFGWILVSLRIWRSEKATLKSEQLWKNLTVMPKLFTLALLVGQSPILFPVKRTSFLETNSLIAGRLCQQS